MTTRRHNPEGYSLNLRRLWKPCVSGSYRVLTWKGRFWKREINGDNGQKSEGHKKKMGFALPSARRQDNYN